jgi:hypothetical protein
MLHNILTWLLVLKVRTETHYFQHSPLDAQGTCLKDHPANGLHLVNISWGCVIFSNYQQRLREAITDIHKTLIGMALDPRLMPGVAAGMRSIRSSASTPSLRSREGSITPGPRMDTAGGNVRVVVRVRAFLPRGMK